jgi:hypothetical protein
MKLRLAIGILHIAMITGLLVAVPKPTMAQEDNIDNATHMATGCLRQGPTGNIFLLTDENGKMWSLRSKTVPLKVHVGHTVTVTGTIPKPSNDSGDTAPQNYLVVSKVEMVRDNCKQP